MGGKLVDKGMFGWVLAHPLRCHALTILGKRESSPVDIGRELDVGVSHVAYHIRILREAQLIVPTEEVPRHGSVEHRYAALATEPLTNEQYARLSAEERALRARNVFCLAVADANCALSSGTFWATNFVSRFPMKLDGVGRKEVRDLFETVDVELLRIREEAYDRLCRSGAGSTQILAFGTFFEMSTEGGAIKSD